MKKELIYPSLILGLALIFAGALIFSTQKVEVNTQVDSPMGTLTSSMVYHTPTIIQRGMTATPASTSTLCYIYNDTGRDMQMTKVFTYWREAYDTVLSVAHTDNGLRLYVATSTHQYATTTTSTDLNLLFSNQLFSTSTGAMLSTSTPATISDSLQAETWKLASGAYLVFVLASSTERATTTTTGFCGVEGWLY